MFKNEEYSSFIIKVFCVHKVFIALFVEYPLCFLYAFFYVIICIYTC